MSTDPRVVPPAPKERARIAEHLRMVEERRRQADSFAWTVPGLTLASQAFLLTIALDSDRSDYARLLVATFGILIVLAAGHFLVKQVHNFDLYESVIEYHRIRLGYYGAHRDQLVQDLKLLGPLSDRPVARQYRRRWIAGWNDDDSPRLKWHVRLKVVWVWLFALIVIFAVDVGLVIDAALDLAP